MIESPKNSFNEFIVDGVLLLLTIFTLIAISGPMTAKAGGNEGGHGGDSYAIEFYELARLIYIEIKKEKYSSLRKRTHLNLEELSNHIEFAELDSAEGNKVTLVNDDGEEVEKDAINFPDEDRILINRTRWRMASLDYKLKMVLHEYFGLLKLELDVYNISRQYASALVVVYKKLITTNPMSPLRYHGMCVGSPPLYKRGNACDVAHESIAKAKTCAEDFAKAQCEFEQGRDCRVSVPIVEKVQSSEHAGFTYCEVTVIAK